MLMQHTVLSPRASAPTLKRLTLLVAFAISDGFGSAHAAQNVINVNAGVTNVTSTANSGANSLRKTGAGTLVLTGTNTYTAGTIITGGILQLGNGGTVGSIVGNVAVESDATLGFYRSNAINFAGVISGAGNLVKDGSNTLTLTGNNTYSGSTVVNAGTLAIGNGSTAGNLVSDVALASGASLAFNRSDAASYSGTITGTGDFIKNAANALTFTGTNNSAGTTTINAGTLSIGNGGTAGYVAGNAIVNSGATLAFNRADAVSYAGNISGTGYVVKNGSGTLVLTGKNTASRTTVNAGTLQIGDGGATGSLTGNIYNYGTVEFNRSDNFKFTNSMIGTGNLVKRGTGTMGISPITAINTGFNGKLILSEGVVELSDGAMPNATIDFAGGALNLVGVAANKFTASGGEYVFKGNESFIASDLGGDGVTFNAKGTLSFIGDNTYTGLTTVGKDSLLNIGWAPVRLDRPHSDMSAGETGSLISDVYLSTPTSQLRFLRSNAYTYAGNVTGTGKVWGGGRGSTSIMSLTGNIATDIELSGWISIGDGGTSGTFSGNATGQGTLLFNRSDALTYAGSISGPGSLIKSGAGVLTLTGSSTFTGVTNVNSGTLTIGNGGITGAVTSSIVVKTGATLAFNRADNVNYTGSITGAGTLVKNGTGTLSLASQTGFTGNTLVAQGELRSGGWLGSSVSIATGATLTGTGRVGNLNVEGLLSAAAGVGTLTANSATFAGGSSYLWEISDASGVAGTGYDLFSTSGGLTFSATADNKFTVKLSSLDAYGNAGYLASGINPGVSHSYTLMTADGSITGYSADAFLVDASGFTFNGQSNGVWSVVNTGHQLNLIYTTAVPEPETYAMFLAGLAGVGFMARRRRGARAAA